MLKVHWGRKLHKVYTCLAPKFKKNWGRKSRGSIYYIPGSLQPPTVIFGVRDF